MRISTLLVCLAWGGAAWGGPIAVEDAQGRLLRLAAPAQRIVALAPHFVENLFAIGAGSQLVAAVDFVDFPPEARALPSVGAYNSLSAEAILSHDPDLVLVWQSGNSAALQAQLHALGLPVFVDEPRRLQDVAQGLRRLGRLSGHEHEARALGRRFEQRVQALRERHAGAEQLKVFYQIWHEPLQTLNGEHVVSDLIRLCGGVNVFADALPLAPRVSVEAVLARAPDIIIASGQSAEARPALAFWRRWTQLPAVRDGRLHAIRPDWMLRFTPRMLDGASRLCGILEAARRPEYHPRRDESGIECAKQGTDSGAGSRAGGGRPDPQRLPQECRGQDQGGPEPGH